MTVQEIINKHVDKQPDRYVIHGGATYSGGRTPLMDNLCAELELKGFKIGTDCGSGRECGYALLYVY